jgi:hypothetical protein
MMITKESNKCRVIKQFSTETPFKTDRDYVSHIEALFFLKQIIADSSHARRRNAIDGAFGRAKGTMKLEQGVKLLHDALKEGEQ